MVKLPDVQTSPGSYVLTVGFNRNLTDSDTVTDLFIFGFNADLFNFNATTRIVTAKSSLSSGRYKFFVNGRLNGDYRNIPVFVDVIAVG